MKVEALVYILTSIYCRLYIGLYVVYTLCRLCISTSVYRRLYIVFYIYIIYMNVIYRRHIFNVIY
jgi:hypothetical protein